jgi:hypothetical protein
MAAQQATDMVRHTNCVDLAIGTIGSFLSFNSLIDIYPTTESENCQPSSPESHLFGLCDIYPESNNVSSIRQVITDAPVNDPQITRAMNL